MPGHIDSHHSRLGNARVFGIPTSPLHWRAEELLAYRDFVVRQHRAQIDDPLAQHAWPKLRDPTASLARFQEEFSQLMEKRTALLQDEFAVRRELSWSRRILHETPVVRAEIEHPANPSIPLLQFRLAQLFDRLDRESGPAEIVTHNNHRQKSCWIRDLAKGGSPRRAGNPLNACFLSGTPGSEGLRAEAATEYDRWLRLEACNKTNFNRLRLVLPAREITFSNTRRARLLLAAIRRTFWRLTLFAIADRLNVVFIWDGSGRGFYGQQFGLPAQETKRAHCVDGSGNVRERTYSMLASPCGSIGAYAWHHPRLVAARALFPICGQTNNLRYILATTLKEDGLVCHLDKPLPTIPPSEISSQEARCLEAFDQDGIKWWRVWTFDSFRDLPVAELPTLGAAVQFLRCNCTLEGIRIGLRST